MKTIEKLKKENAELKALVRSAGSFYIKKPNSQSHDFIIVEACWQVDDSILWACRNRGMVLSKDGEWEYEPMPSSRTEAFLKRCRFKTLKAALKAGKKVAESALK